MADLFLVHVAAMMRTKASTPAAFTEISVGTREHASELASVHSFKGAGVWNGREFVTFECGNGKSSTIAPKRRLIGGIKHELATIA